MLRSLVGSEMYIRDKSNFWTVGVSRSKSNFLPLGAILLAKTLTPQEEEDHPEERERQRGREGRGHLRECLLAPGCTHLSTSQWK